MKTSELTGTALAWAVFLADDDSDQVGIEDGKPVLFYADSDGGNVPYRPDINWSQGGPIIERESLWVRESAVATPAVAHLIWPSRKWFSYATQDNKGQAPAPYYGETFLISAMRCFVSSKLGDEIDIPKELQ